MTDSRSDRGVLYCARPGADLRGRPAAPKVNHPVVSSPWKFLKAGLSPVAPSRRGLHPEALNNRKYVIRYRQSRLRVSG